MELRSLGPQTGNQVVNDEAPALWASKGNWQECVITLSVDGCVTDHASPTTGVQCTTSLPLDDLELVLQLHVDILIAHWVVFK